MFKYIKINGYQVRITTNFSDKHIFNKKDVYIALNIPPENNHISSIDVAELIRLWFEAKNKIDDLYNILEKENIDIAGSVDVYPDLDNEWQGFSRIH